MNEFDKVNSSRVLKQSGAFIHELKPLEKLPEQVWGAPLSPTKWSLKEMVCHLWKWDQYLLEEMIPKIKDGAELPAFTDIEPYNQQARKAAQAFETGKSLLQVFEQTRKALVESIEAIYDPNLRFTVIGEEGQFSLDSFLMIFVHHDEHHKKQLDSFIGSSQGRDQEEADVLLQAASIEGIQNVRMVERDEIHLVGLAARTTNALEMGEEAKIPKLWEQFWQSGIRARVLEQLGGEEVYSLYSDYQNGADGEYNVLVGYRVLSLTGLSNVEGLQTAVIPAAKYAVFTTNRGPVMKIIPEAWQTIWRWAEESDLERTFTGDFELYDERSINPEDSQVDIYIAIK